VGAGWQLGVRGLRDQEPRDGGAPYLARAGFSTELPIGFGRGSLASFTRTFRDRLFAVGLVAEAVEARPAAPRVARFIDEATDLLEGEKAIAFRFQVSLRTVQRWAEEGLVPLRRTVAGRIWARASEVEAWFRGAPAPDSVR
jgi:hypothetical protein